MSSFLDGKTAIVIGERDGVQGPSIAQCLQAAGANVAYTVTECFV
jgi:betaine reductase